MSESLLEFDVMILGGGAAGLAAAVAFGRRAGGKASFAVIEKEQRLGRKLLATGSGRCNLTNLDMTEEYYNAAARPFVKNMISRVSPERLISSFETLGLLCRPDSAGRVYPCSNQAASVLDVLTLWLESTGGKAFCGCKVESVKKTDEGYLLRTSDKTFLAKTLILASGGAVSKALGSDGSSYRFARDLSLLCEKVYPSLAPVNVADKKLSFVKGVRAAAAVTLEADGKTLAREEGELQFNEKNISGICIFQLSRYVNEFFALGTAEGKKCRNISVCADLMPDVSEEQLFDTLKKRCGLLPEAKADELLTGVLNKKLGGYILKRCGVPCSGRSLSGVSERELRLIVKTIKRCGFTPSAPSNPDSAQVTAGGIQLSQVDRNMKSKTHDGLYIIGEALDADGLCGGYNLHFAFAGGIIAGTHAAKAEGKKHDKDK